MDYIWTIYGVMMDHRRGEKGSIWKKKVVLGRFRSISEKRVVFGKEGRFRS